MVSGKRHTLDWDIHYDCQAIGNWDIPFHHESWGTFAKTPEVVLAVSGSAGLTEQVGPGQRTHQSSKTQARSSSILCFSYVSTGLSVLGSQHPCPWSNKPLPQTHTQTRAISKPSTAAVRSCPKVSTPGSSRGLQECGGRKSLLLRHRRKGLPRLLGEWEGKSSLQLLRHFSFGFHLLLHQGCQNRWLKGKENIHTVKSYRCWKEKEKYG